jgi:uncharacterized protein (AIM24 family)
MRGAARLVMAFVLIVAALLLAQWLHGLWADRAGPAQQLEALELRLGELEPRAVAAAADVERLRRDLDGRVALLVQGRSAEIATTSRELETFLKRASRAATEAALKATSAAEARLAANRSWNALPWYVRREALAPFSEQGRAWAVLEARAVAAETAHRAARDLLGRTAAERDALVSKRDAAQRALQAEIATLRKEHGPALLQAQKTADELSRELAATRKEHAAVARRLESTALEKARTAIRGVLPAAVLALALWLAVPLVWKLATYYGVARLVEGRAPIRLDPPRADGDVVRQAIASGVSLEVNLGPTEQLVVQSAYLQSTPPDTVRDTLAVLSKRYWLSSFTAGMYLPTRVTPRGVERARVRVTATDDVLGELCMIDVPAGAGLVLRPSSLAGVVHDRGREIAIRSRWRLASLHAWCSWQLRFLEFRGPCRLIVKGTRGVRVEALGERDSRLVNGSATLGFLPSLPFQVARTETFVPYLRGREPLFNDRFGPGPGLIVYEERPSGRDGARVTRALTSWFDAFRQGLGV